MAQGIPVRSGRPLAIAVVPDAERQHPLGPQRLEPGVDLLGGAAVEVVRAVPEPENGPRGPQTRVKCLKSTQGS